MSENQSAGILNQVPGMLSTKTVRTSLSVAYLMNSVKAMSFAFSHSKCLGQKGAFFKFSVLIATTRYGEILNLDMPRDKQTGKARGFVFLQYEDQRSTVLAVDNLNGAKVLGRVLRVDHAQRPKPKKDEDGNLPDEPSMNAAPPLLGKC